MSKNHRNPAAEVAAKFDICLEESVSTRAVQQELRKSNIHRRAAIATPLITENNTKRRKRLCVHKTLMSYVWKYVIWSDKSSFTFPTSGQVYVRRTRKEVYNTDCLVLTVKHGSRSVKIWAAMSWYSAGPIITLNG